MIRGRFHADAADSRPVNWPVKHPYWCTGHGDGYSIVVAYADDEAEILRNWPEATNINAEEVTEYVFTSRFPKPDWFNPVVKQEQEMSEENWIARDAGTVMDSHTRLDVVLFNPAQNERSIVHNVRVLYPNSNWQTPLFVTRLYSNNAVDFEPEIEDGPIEGEFILAVETSGAYVTHYRDASLTFPPPTAHNEP